MHEALGFITTVNKVNFIIGMYLTKMFKEEEEGNTMSYAPPADQKGKCHAHGLSSGPMKIHWKLALLPQVPFLI